MPRVVNLARLFHYCNGPDGFRQLEPMDGTPPFWVAASHNEEGYDSDEDFDTIFETVSTFSQQSGKQLLKSKSNPDQRFLWSSYVPQPWGTRLARRGFVVKGADTMISLSPDPEDTLLVRSEQLIKSHPYFRTGFSGRWSSNKLMEPVLIKMCTIKYRYELELEDNGDTILIGKTSPTPEDERRRKWDEARERAIKKLADGTASRSNHHDEFRLRLEANVVHELESEGHHFMSMAAYKLGFAMLCGYNPKRYSKGSKADWSAVGRLS